MVGIYDSSQNYVGTTLTNPDYLTKLHDFWNYVHQNPGKHGSLKADTAVVLPEDYAFGFRSPTDSVWQYHSATSWTQKMYSDITALIGKDQSKIDVVYSDAQFQAAVRAAYSKVLYWPADFEGGLTYPVTDLNDSLGYSTIQDALSSFATYEGATVLVQPGTYQGNVAVNKAVTLTSQDKNTTILQAQGGGTALTIAADNVTVSGFTVENSAFASSTLGTGIQLQNAHYCAVADNVVANNYVGVLLVNSTDNVFRGNTISGNINNLVFQNSSPNDLDSSNTVNGKPYSP